MKYIIYALIIILAYMFIDYQLYINAECKKAKWDLFYIEHCLPR